MVGKHETRWEATGHPRFRWVLGPAALLLVLGILVYDPVTSLRLFRDVTQHEALFRQAASEVLQGRSVSPDDPTYLPLFQSGYYQIDNHRGAVLFWRYKHWLGSGITGVAYIPAGAQPDFGGWMHFTDAPPHLERQRMPTDFYIFSEP